jgi:hypothetical protein
MRSADGLKQVPAINPTQPDDVATIASVAGGERHHGRQSTSARVVLGRSMVIASWFHPQWLRAPVHVMRAAHLVFESTRSMERCRPDF